MSDRSMLPLLGTDPTLGELMSARRLIGTMISARLHEATRDPSAAAALRAELAAWDYLDVLAAATETVPHAVHVPQPDDPEWWHRWREALVAELEARRHGCVTGDAVG